MRGVEWIDLPTNATPIGEPSTRMNEAGDQEYRLHGQWMTEAQLVRRYPTQGEAPAWHALVYLLLPLTVFLITGTAGWLLWLAMK